jgi:hypothetical protein
MGYDKLMNLDKLKTHVKLCLRNLKSKRVVCCGNCPFEEEIVSQYPEMKNLFERKRMKK